MGAALDADKLVCVLEPIIGGRYANLTLGRSALLVRLRDTFTYILLSYFVHAKVTSCPGHGSARPPQLGYVALLAASPVCLAEVGARKKKASANEASLNLVCGLIIYIYAFL